MKKIYLLLIASLLLGISCQKDDAGNSVTHYKTIGEGYVYNATHNIPIKGATITVKSHFKSSTELFGPYPSYETFTTDENGYYQIKFIKWGKNSKVSRYFFTISSNLPVPPYWSIGVTSNTFPDKSLTPEDLKGKKIITLDTVKFYQNSF